jgi:hypothetical protein
VFRNLYVKIIQEVAKGPDPLIRKREVKKERSKEREKAVGLGLIYHLHLSLHLKRK